MTEPLTVKIGSRNFHPVCFSRAVADQVEAWLIGKAEADLDQTASGISDAGKAQLRAHLAAQIDGGHFRMGGPAYTDAVQTKSGAAHVLWLLLHPNHPDLTPDQVWSMWESHPTEMTGMVDRVVNDFLRRARKG